MSVLPPPREIEWSRLSPPTREIVKHVTMRVTAGYSYEEIAETLERERPSFRHLELPKGKPVSKGWVMARARLTPR